MSAASRWLDGLVTTAWLLGLRGDELRAALPDEVGGPAWLDQLEGASSREERARILAPRVARLSVALEETKPTWRLHAAACSPTSRRPR